MITQIYQPLRTDAGIAFLAGAVAGAAEVAMPGQPLSYAMNQAIKNEPFVPSQAYKGFAANALGQAPITALQMGIQAAGKSSIEHVQGSAPTFAQNLGISYAAGVGAATVDTISNAVQLWLQRPENAGKTTRDAFKALGSKCWRGYAPNAFLKEGPFAVGYQTLAPRMQQAMGSYMGEGIVSSIAGGVSAGVITALITHPGAVIRNKMQGDIAKTTYTTTMQTARKIYQDAGYKGFFAGLGARGTRIAFAIPLYTAYTSAITSWAQKKKPEPTLNRQPEQPELTTTNPIAPTQASMYPSSYTCAGIGACIAGAALFTYIKKPHLMKKLYDWMNSKKPAKPVQ